MAQDELAKLEAELARVDAENAKLEHGDKKSFKDVVKSHFIEPWKEYPGQVAHTVARAGKLVAKTAAFPANLPVLGYNLAAATAGKPEHMVDYPSERVGAGVDWLTGGRSKSRNKYEETMEPYQELGLGMVTGSAYAKLLEKAAAKAAIKGSTKAAKTLSRTGKVIGAGSALNAPTAARNVGALYGAQRAGEIYPESPLVAPIVGSVIGGTVGKSAHSVTNLANPKSWSQAVEEAALRHPKIGKKFIEQTPTRYGAEDILKQDASKVGKTVQEGVRGYLGKATGMWGRLEKRLDTTAKTSPVGNEVSISRPLIKVVNEFKKLDDPVLQNDFMRSPIGQELIKHMRLSPKTTGEDFAALIADRASLKGLVNQRYTVSDLLKLRRNIDNDISKKGHMPIGTYDEKDLRSFRGSLAKSIGKKFKEMGEVPHSQYKRYMSNYERFAETKKDKINDILEHKFSPGKAYDAATQDLTRHVEYPEFVSNTLTGAAKENFGKSLLGELGRTGDGFDLDKASKNFANLSHSSKEKVLATLSKSDKDAFLKQLDIHKGYNKILHKENNIVDTLLRTPALSVRKALLKTRGKRYLGEKFNNPEGIERLEKRAIDSTHETSNTVSKPSFLSAPLRAVPHAKNAVGKDEMTQLFKQAEKLGVDISDIWQ